MCITNLKLDYINKCTQFYRLDRKSVDRIEVVAGTTTLMLAQLKEKEKRLKGKEVIQKKRLKLLSEML